ncbi:uncharacterized protein LOC133895220 [Phragmites australis]|uniref:uncharacterized protein LOC133895220 n=1 Tax=Phragmites australis TaxID=29695 RepID=UPI002D793294|nr:uncharacterized protein LOC133895220 [Phragmites australis]
MEVERKPAVPSISSASVSGTGCGEFTEADLAAADQLMQLSVSGGGEEEDQEACSSSARSVNNAVAGEREEHAGMVDRRARKRYRLVSELYAATRARGCRSRQAAGAASGRASLGQDRQLN